MDVAAGRRDTLRGGRLMHHKDRVETDFSADLLRYLRRKLELPSLGYLERPTLIGKGTGAWILGFRLGDAPAEYDCPLVLRVLRAGVEPMQVDLEHAVQNAVADQGFPAPRVLMSSKQGDELGRPFLIMVRVPNDLLIAGLLPAKRTFAAARRVLQLSRIVQRPLELQMETLARLHSLDTIPLENALKIRGVSRNRLSAERRLEDVFSWIDAWKLNRFRPLADWLQTRRPVPGRISICHGDPHPMNILISKGKLAAMIDWEEAQLGHPALDVGAFCGHLRTLLPFPLARGSWVRNWQQRLIDKHLAAYERHRRIDREVVRYHETEFLAWVIMHITERRIRRACGQAVLGNPLMDNPRATGLIQEHLQAVIGIAIPSAEEVIIE